MAEKLPIRFHIDGIITAVAKDNDYSVGDLVVYSSSLYRVEEDLGKQGFYGSPYHGFRLTWEKGGIKYG